MHLLELEKMVKKIPPECLQEVYDFIEFVINKRARSHHKKPSFKWAGALKDLNQEYTSVELQHKISELRAGFK